MAVTQTLSEGLKREFEVIITKSMVTDITSTNKYQFHARCLDSSNQVGYYKDAFVNNLSLIHI